MTLFREDGSESRLCSILKGVVEEYGPENTTVTVPESFLNNDAMDSYKGPDGNYYLSSRCRLFFSDKNEIRVHAHIDGKEIWSYAVEVMSL